MSIRFVCEQCGKELSAADSMAGRKARCTRCDAPVNVPQPSSQDVSDQNAGGEPQRPLDELEVIEDDAPVALPPVAVKATPRGAKTSPPKKKPKHVDHSPMFPSAKAEHDQDLIDMTAMVDIVFFLLIFFLVTSMQAMQAVLPMPKPETAAKDNAKAQSVTNMINDPNTVIIKIEENDAILVDDEEVFGEQALNLTLRQLREEDASEPSVLIMGSPFASHGAAVKVLDACASAKIANVRFLVQEEDEE